MKFRVETNWLLRKEEDMELDPKNFIHCANIEELNDEIHDYISTNMEFPELNELSTAECLGKYFWDTTYGEFMLEWQKLKGLPQEL